MEELLATLIEAVDATSWRQLTPHLKKGAQIPRPIRIPRPGDQRRRRRRASPAETAAFFAQARKGVTDGD